MKDWNRACGTVAIGTPIDYRDAAGTNCIETQKAIPAELARLREAVDQNEDLLNMLRGRLQPLILEVPRADGCDKVAAAASVSKLAAEIREVAWKVRVNNEALAYLLGVIEI
jgi:hypothetical protein